MRARFLSAFLWVAAATVFLSGCGSAPPKPSAASSERQHVEQVFIGKPGPVPHRDRMPATEFGAYTFASERNFCRSSRWLISGTMPRLWPDEPKPRLVMRGTFVHVLERKHVACGDLDDRLSLVGGDLVRYRTSGGERWVRAGDVYSTAQYHEYQQKQELVHKRDATPVVRPTATLAAIDIPSAVLTRGYEEGLRALFDSGGSAATHAGCDVGKAAQYVVEARQAFSTRAYRQARTLAYGAVVFTDNCHNEDRPDQARGDGLLLFSKAELRLGMLTAGKNDADAAAASYLECTFDDRGYSAETVDYCSRHREEAHGIVQNG